MAEERDANYQPNARYLVEIDGIALMACEKATFGDSEWGIIEGRTGADPLYALRGTFAALPLRKSPSRIH